MKAKVNNGALDYEGVPLVYSYHCFKTGLFTNTTVRYFFFVVNAPKQNLKAALIRNKPLLKSYESVKMCF